ncbi:MFS transporter [Kiritimatiellota bacterium B12222]|nr:MFS transporter [Kiritimatiellota bacterium B12222]
MKLENPILNDPAALAQRTFFWEKIRSLFTGLIEIIWQPGASVALLVAIRYYGVDSELKSLISASNPIGFLVTPMSLSLFAALKRPINEVMGVLFIVAGLCLFAITVVDNAFWFVVGSVLASVVMAQYVPMYTEMYSRNFTTTLRGNRISTVFIIGGAVSIVANLIVGELLDYRLEMYKVVMAVGAISCWFSAFCLMRIPSEPLNASEVGMPWKSLSLAWKDKLFGWLLSSWMLLGFGNLMTLPLRTEYMANPRFGVDASNQMILFITGAVPLLCRLASSRILGKLFDRWNLVNLRIMLNVMFLFSVMAFFSTKNLWVMGLSMALLGTAMAGGRIAWSLWVTKLAPPGQTSAYMTVHMFTTGLRGTLGPFVGFALIENYSAMQVSGLGSLLIIISTLMFIPARTHMDLRGRELDAMALDPRRS